MDDISSASLSNEAGQQQRSSHGHNTHALPPQGICDVYKKYQKMSDADVNSDPDVIDFSRGLSPLQKLKVQLVETLSTQVIEAASREFLGSDEDKEECEDSPRSSISAPSVYAHTDFPGLKLFPALLPPKLQVALLDRLLHRDLSLASHKTNLHADYHIPYPPPVSPNSSRSSSFFTIPESSPAHTLTPLNPHSSHQALNLAQFLRKRWRWLTFGAQYDWSTRQYPPKEEVPTQFPPDIAKLVATLFPRIKAESGVVLIYGSRDFMPVHRDVSELCERELCSFTLGCDGLFIVALDQDRTPAGKQPASGGSEESQIAGDDRERPQKTVVIRVQSGDVVQMAGPTRWSWHAMPKVMAGSCPDFLRDWPVTPGMDPKDKQTKAYQKWRGYMSGKRVNISCRQVYD